jgi:hypothetical protein
MRRRKLSRRASKRLVRSARRVKRANIVKRVHRGGIRF